MRRQRFLRYTLAILALLLVSKPAGAEAWIRINQLGYLPQQTKVAVLMSEEPQVPQEFRLVDAFTDETVMHSKKLQTTGPMGQMQATARLDFSTLKREGTYYIEAGAARSPHFAISNSVYDGTADFLLRYMRQQRCGWNPFMRDACHQKDGFVLGHPTKDSTYLDVRGGWHDATDCLQYTTTSANAIYQLMLAWEQNPDAFGDAFAANGLPGANGVPDIIDEIAWGMQWLSRMNPAEGEMYNQIADDRDHVGMRLPNAGRADYGRGPGNGRPVYFCSGLPQQQGKGMNKTTGVASTAGKFASDFALGARILAPYYPELAKEIEKKAASAYAQGERQPGCCQTASVRSPYIYEESNWVDDMELAAAELFRATGESRYLDAAADYGRREPVTPWMGADTARHYQWYPFMNAGHYRLATFGTKKQRREFVSFMRRGIEAVWHRAQSSPFRNGIPAIWCSNNLTTAMLTQCILYRQLTGSRRYDEMEAALRDWLFGCNPWGTSMVVGLPLGGTFPREPHSQWFRLGMGNATGGLVDGPVYASIFGSLWGVSLTDGEAYARFQPGNMVYHDCTTDYSTNEPTMDGTACLAFPLSAYAEEGRRSAQHLPDRNVYQQDGIIQGDPQRKRICLVFTAADRADGADHIITTLHEKRVPGGFFFTGKFFEMFPDVVRRLVAEGHYVGSHSYGHLLYFPWGEPENMSVTQAEFDEDMKKSFALLHQFGIKKEQARYFIPPYEHYNALVASWARLLGLQVINYTPGTASNGDYTIPSMKNYYSSDSIFRRIIRFEEERTLNGHFLLLHLGTHPDRTDKFYFRLAALIDELRRRGYEFVSVPDMIEH
ncbi:MAG: glycoside hydrolase family 9 protein [Bacteroidaceae bacterium]|nr:glycoside hydrolase family 9 protein [Bacteroidaceae bacterium]